MKTFTIRTSFSAKEVKQGDDLVIRNSIGRAVDSDVIQDLRKNGHEISPEVEQATSDARDADIRAFMGLDLDANLGQAINKHFRKVVSNQYR